MRTRLKGHHKQACRLAEGSQFCNVAAALVGTAVVGAAFAPSAPDPNPGMQANAAASERVGMAQVDLANRQFEESKARNARMDEITKQVTDAQLATMAKQNALADDYANYNKTTFRPLEESMVADANAAGGTAAQEAAASRAGADVAQAMTIQKGAAARDMARMGVNPASGRSAASNDALVLGGALGAAGAENTARLQEKQLGWAKKMDAASLGRGLPAANATATQLGINAGSSAVGNQGASVQSGNQSAATTGSLYAGAVGAFGTSGNLSNMAAQQATSIYGIQAQQNSAMMQGIGSGIGMYYGMKKTA